MNKDQALTLYMSIASVVDRAEDRMQEAELEMEMAKQHLYWAKVEAEKAYTVFENL